MRTASLSSLLRTLSLILTMSVLGCDSEEHLPSVVEPIVVNGAELKAGELPSSNAEGRATVTSLEISFGEINPGTPGLSIKGRTSGDAYSVGLRLLETGSGYWVHPLGPEDVTNPGELTYELKLNASPEIKPGNYTLAVVAFDSEGRPGAQSVISVCVASTLPDNLNGCNPTSEPPPAIVQLSWNNDADLDLILEAPDGSRFDRRNAGLIRGGTRLFGLQSDGVSGCLADGRRYENFVWNEPISGTWLAYANLFDACGKAAVAFTLTVYRSQDNGDGSYKLVAEDEVHGSFIRAQANGGAGNPLYLTAIEF